MKVNSTTVNHWRKGGVAVAIRDDRTVHIYAPEADRVLSAPLVDELMEFLVAAGYSVPVSTLSAVTVNASEGEGVVQVPVVEVDDSESKNATVPSGEVTTSRRGRPRKSG